MGGVRGGGGVKRVRGGGGERIFFYRDREGEIREKVVIFINNLAQTGKILLHLSIPICLMGISS